MFLTTMRSSWLYSVGGGDVREWILRSVTPCAASSFIAALTERTGLPSLASLLRMMSEVKARSTGSFPAAFL